jgi:hypothetical protein
MGRWALLVGALVACGLTALAPARYPDWLNLLMCALSGCVAAWAAMHAAERRKSDADVRPDEQTESHSADH